VTGQPVFVIATMGIIFKTGIEPISIMPEVKK